VGGTERVWVIYEVGEFYSEGMGGASRVCLVTRTVL
jgi:hypothetical protein